MVAKKLKKGLFITFEGIEGSGKTTQSRMLFEYLTSMQYDCIYTREPGGTRLGEEIRKILLHSNGVKISDITELFLFEAARSQIVKEIIAPALKKGKIVICDRFSDATVSYQGYGGGVPIPAIRALDLVATGGLTPDLTFVMDIPTITGLARAKRKGFDRMEAKDISYHNRVRRGYHELAKKYHKRIRVVLTKGPIKEVQDSVRREVQVVIHKHQRSG